MIPGLGLRLENYLPDALYFGGIFVFLLSIFWKPRIGLYFLVPLLPLQTVRYRLQDFPLGEKFVDIILLGVILGLVVRGQGWFPPKAPFNKFLAVFALFYYFSLWRGAFYLGSALPIWYTDPRFSEWKNYMIMPVICLVVANAFKDTRQMKLLILLMCCSVLLLNRSYYNTVGQRDLSHYSDTLRYAGALGYAGENGFAAFETQFSLFLLGIYAFARNKLAKLGILVVVLFSAYCLALSFSRGGYVGMLVGLIFLGIHKERKLLLVPLALLIWWQAFVPAAVQERILMTYQKDEIEGEELDPSAADRLALWQDAMIAVSQSPILGTGFETYKYLGRLGAYRDTHNYYVKVLFETGILGLPLFLWFLSKAFRLGQDLFRSGQDPFLRSMGLGFAGLIVGAIVLNLFGDRWTYLQVNGYLWALLGCVIRAQRMVHQQLQKSGANEAIPRRLGASSSRVAAARFSGWGLKLMH